MAYKSNRRNKLILSIYLLLILSYSVNSSSQQVIKQIIMAEKNITHTEGQLNKEQTNIKQVNQNKQYKWQQYYQEQILQFQNQQHQIISPTILIHEVHSLESIEFYGQKKLNQKQKTEKIDLDNQKVYHISTIQLQHMLEQQNEQKNKCNQGVRNGNDLSNYGININVCHIQSKQSLSQNVEYLDNTDIHIQTHTQLRFIEEKNDVIKSQIKKYQKSSIQKNNLGNEEQSNQNCSRLSQQKSQKDDYYVQLLEQKWAKRQKLLEDKIKCPQTIVNSKQNNAVRQKFKPQKQLKQQKSIKIYSKDNNALFKINKKKDQRMIRTGQNFISAKKSNQQLYASYNNPNHTYQKKGQFLAEPTKSSQKQLKLNKRSIKKHHSNLESINRSLDRSRSRKLQKQDSKNISYEIQIGNSVQMMSKLLQDRYYNNKSSLGPKNDKNQHSTKKRNSWQNDNKLMKRNLLQSHKIRKIIKLSPYGLLQIQVKQKKHNNSKITNLRILKPRQIIKLKKVSKINKQNHIQQNKQNRIYVFNQGQLPKI